MTTKDQKVFLLSSDRTFALKVVRVLNQSGVSAVWVTQRDAERLLQIWPVAAWIRDVESAWRN